MDALTTIGLIISLLTIVGFFLKLNNDAKNRQTEQKIADAEMKLQLTHIQTDIKKIDVNMSKRDNYVDNCLDKVNKKVDGVDERLTEIEYKCKYTNKTRNEKAS